MKRGPKNRKDLVAVIQDSMLRHKSLFPIPLPIQFNDNDPLVSEYRHEINNLCSALTVRLPLVNVREAILRVVYYDVLPDHGDTRREFELFCQDIYLGLQDLRQKYFGKVYKESVLVTSS